MNEPSFALLDQLKTLTDQAADRQRLQGLFDAMVVHVVVVPRSGAPSLHQFTSLAATADHLRGLNGQDVQVFLFHGHRLAITRGPHRYLVGTAGERLPLFRAEDQDVDPDGWLNESPVVEVLPLTPPAPPTDPLT